MSENKDLEIIKEAQNWLLRMWVSYDDFDKEPPNDHTVIEVRKTLEAASRMAAEIQKLEQEKIDLINFIVGVSEQYPEINKSFEEFLFPKGFESDSKLRS